MFALCVEGWVHACVSMYFPLSDSFMNTPHTVTHWMYLLLGQTLHQPYLADLWSFLCYISMINIEKISAHIQAFKAFGDIALNLLNMFLEPIELTYFFLGLDFFFLPFCEFIQSFIYTYTYRWHHYMSDTVLSIWDTSVNKTHKNFESHFTREEIKE